MISSATPASFAGTAFISTDDGYAAVPPGMYSPTRSSGSTSWPRTTPSRGATVKPLRTWQRWNASRLSRARAIMAIVSGATASAAASHSSRGISTVSQSAPSNRRE